MSRMKNASRNIVWGTLNKIVGLGLPFITRTVMIHTLGIEYIGLGSLFTSILQVLSFAELGIGGAMVFSMYKPIAEGNDVKVSALLNLYRRTYRIIGTIILIAGLCIMPFLDDLVAGDVPTDINLYILFLIFLFNNIIGYFLFAYKYSLFTATQRMDMISKIGMALNCVSSISQIVILLTTKNYYIYVVVVPLTTLFNNLIVGFITDRVFPQYKCRGEVDFSEKKLIEKKVGGMVFQKIGGIVLGSVDTIVISAFLGLRSLALYQNYFYVITALFGFLMVFMQSIIAGVGNSVVSESLEKNYKDFNKFSFIYVWIVSWCTICLLCLYQPFIELWIGKENLLGNEMVLLFAMYFFVHKWCDMLYVYQEACGIWWETKFIPLVAAIVNLIINVVLVQIIGLPGILISTIVAVVFIYDIGYARVLFKTYFKSVKDGLRHYCRRQFLYFVTMLVSAIITGMICHYVKFNVTIVQLIINGIVCIIVPNVLIYIVWNRCEEFTYVKQIVLKFLRRVIK